MSSKIIRPLLPRDPAQTHRASTTLELLFDLVSVIAIAAVTAGLHHAISEGHGLEALPRFIFLFLAIWWAWMNFTWFASAFDNDDALYRILVLVIMCGALIFAGGAGHIFETLDFSFGLLGWIIMRLGMIGLWLRAAAGSPEHRTTARRYAAGIAFAQVMWCAFYFVTAPGSTMFFLFGSLCFMIEWAVPPYAERANVTPFHRHHMIERYGLLMIISLGEIMLSVSHGFGQLFGDHPAPEAAQTALSSVAIVFALWWLYFCEENHMPKSDFATAFQWGYGHVFIFGATAATGAAIAAEVDLSAHHSAVTQDVVALYLGLPLAIIYGTLWLVRDRLLGMKGHTALALPVMALAFIGAAVAGLPTWVFAALSVIAIWWRAPITGGGRGAHKSSPDAKVH
ncbi:MAG TPA: low temperature requirement protein A [Paracoccaceae bacterium]|nr:low temperature requirement protein A [Paracoccaceae bacterium]